MAERKLYHLHKIKIHHNRWLIWAIVYVLLVTFAIVAYVKISDLNIDSENTSENIYTSWHSYKDSRLGFSLRYPTGWSIEAESSSSISFFPNEYTDNGVNVTVSTTNAENSIRKTLDIADEKKVSVDDNSGTLIINNLGNGQFETVVLVAHSSRLYVLRGSENLIQKILLSFNFLN